MKCTCLIGTFATFGTVLSLAATPVLTDVNVAQEHSSRGVTITYKLPTEAAVVTMDILTNGVSIGATHFAGACGDVNRLVQATAGDAVRQITWDAVAEWPNVKVTNSQFKVALTAWATNAPPDYIVYDLASSDADAPTFYTSADLIPLGVTNELYKTRKLVMRRIHATGVRWSMGSPTSETDRQKNETLHAVTLTNDYYLAIYPFTQGQYKELTGNTQGAYSKSKRNSAWRPCESYSGNLVRYSDVRGGDWPTGGRAGVGENTVIARLRTRTGQDTFDLPTEAQWEFACRAGEEGPFSNGGDYTQANFQTLGWEKGIVLYEEEATDATVQPVGFKEPNGFGLYDMHGTVIELCLDWYQDDLGTAHVLEPVGPASGTTRVTRNGGMAGGWKKARSAYRSSLAQDTGNLSTGFRVMCDAVVK